MDLGQRGASQRRGIDGVEHVALRVAVDVVERLEDGLERQRVALHLQLRQLVAVRLRQNLRARRQRLADLHEAGAQVLQHGAKGLGRETLQEVVLPQDIGYFLEAPRARLPIQMEPILGIDLRTGAEKMRSSVFSGMDGQLAAVR